MNTPWPKFSTSIRPNTSVRPEAMMKIDHAHRQAGDGQRDPGRGRPISGSASSASAASRASGSQSKLGFRDGARGRGGTAFIDAPPATARAGAAAARSSSASSAIAPRCTTRPSSITATVSPSARGHAEVLLDQQDRGVACAFSSRKRRDQVVDDRRRQALARLVDQQQRARLDDGARDRQHLLLPARQLAGRVAARTSSAPGRSRRSSPAARVESSARRAARAASSRFSRTVRSAKMPMLSGT